MRDTGDFQDRVRNLIGPNFNFQIDRPHDDKPVHIDLTSKLPGGADKAEINYDGDIIGGSTSVGPIKMDW